VFNNSIQYRKYNSSMVLVTAEQIAGASASYPHIVCDSSNVPHVVFTDPTNKYANICYYTNRSSGSWKSPIEAFHDSNANIWYPRISLWNGYAFIGFQYAPGGVLLGEVIRLTNLAGNPTVDRSVTTGSRTSSVVDGLGQVYAFGRNNGTNIAVQQYDSNLNVVCGMQSLLNGYPGSPQTGWADKNNVVHFVSWAIVATGSFPCNDRCGLTYNNTGRRAGGTCGAYPSSINSGPGEDATGGPSGTDVSGFWNDDVAPVITVDALDRVYVAWRAWTHAGEGRITKVDNTGWTQTCTPSTACSGSSVCTGTLFCPSITRREWWNCEIAPASGGGVYVVWDNAGTAYIRSVGVALDLTPPAPVNGFSAAIAADSINLSWNNPTDADFAGATIVCKAGGYPVNPNDGTVLADVAGAQGSVGQCVHVGVHCGTPYYYAVFSHDSVFNYSTAAHATAKIQCADFDLDGDVDQADFGVFQHCLSGSGVSYEPGCAAADLDANGAVDQKDFNLFWPCMAGPGQQPGC
jgi:hypothetical protein